MKKLVCICMCIGCVILANAQCALCSRTAQQLGEKPAKGLNAGIIYLMLVPLLIIGIIGYRWWRQNGREAGA